MSHRILIVDDEAQFCELYSRTLSEAGFEVRTALSAEEAEAILRDTHPDLVVSDVRMPGASGLDLLKATRERIPDLPFLLVTAYADVRDAVAALKLGAVDYLAKPVDLDELLACVQDTLGVSAPEPASDIPPGALGDIVAASPQFRAVLRDAWRIARSNATVLLTGESGTGKEVVARFIHRNSSRHDRPIVAVNCAAIPNTLLASELFGHEKGAFTGADTRREGRFREATGGTLFLDEIGDVPLDVQPVLLRAIEQRIVTPLGGRGEIPVDIRLIAATNRSLKERMDTGQFRSDLFYRLNVIALELPPLRERAEDILPLARRFLGIGEGDIRISRAASRALLAHDWPGNVRELANAMERARLLARADVLLPEHLPPAVRRAGEKAGSGAYAGEDLETEGDVFRTLEETEISSIKSALARTGGNRTKAAEILGITRRGLIKKLKRFGI
jgi:DNA-binding NtrC family response regulator